MKEILQRRIQIRELAEKDQGFRKDVLEHCKIDSVFWCNNFATTFDPRGEFYKERDLPFILFRKQVEVVEWIEKLLQDNKDGVIEKSRDTGISYTTLIPIILYRWLFHDFNARIGSRKESYVDTSGDPDSLFWKIEYNLKRLPDWMLPEGFMLDTHRTYMKIVRPDNSNTITGESANPSFARSGRNNIVLFDEFAFWNWARASWEAAGESTNTRLAVSTPPPSGKSSFIYKLVESRKPRVYTLHYSDDPRKDSEWLKKAKEDKSEEEFERELNISYEGTTQGKVYQKNFAFVDIGNYPYRSNLPVYISWDFGLDGTAIQFYQWDMTNDIWYLVDTVYEEDKELEWFVPFITGDFVSGKNYEYTPALLQKIKEHKNWRKDSIHYGDPDVKKRSYHTKRSSSDILRGHGILVQSRQWANRTHYDLKQNAIIFMRKLRINETGNEFFIDCINGARYPTKREDAETVSEPQKPIHDWTSHHRTAFEYMADNAPMKIVRTEKKQYTKPRNYWNR